MEPPMIYQPIPEEPEEGNAIIGLRRLGPPPEQRHICEWVEDESGTEPPFDFCISCGKRRY